MEEFKTTPYIRLLSQGDATSEELEEALGDFTHRIYEFCMKEKNVTFIYFSLHHLRTLLIHIEDRRTETGGKLSANGGIAFVDAAIEWAKGGTQGNAEGTEEEEGEEEEGEMEEEIKEVEEEEEEEDNTSTKELYDCIVICKKNLMIGYFDNCVKIVYSNIDKEEINQINQICENHKKENEKLNNLFIVTYSHNYFSLKQSQVNEPAIQIDRHYNDDFVPVAAEIENFLLEDNKSGLIILHGKQGTGKTTYIRHLINLGKKRMIYMSGDLVDKLSDPSFITFIRQQKNSIFIVEDCEELLSSRNGGNRMNAGLVNILNISDGLLSDELCIKFICTFNAPLKDIDEALLRKGRLAARYEFKDLTTDKVNQLIKEESLDIPEQTHPMTLAEIYNYEGMDFSQGRKRVGF